MEQVRLGLVTVVFLTEMLSELSVLIAVLSCQCEEPQCRCGHSGGEQVGNGGGESGLS